MEQIENFGGMTKAIQAQIPEDEKRRSAARRQAAIDQGKEVS